MHKHSHDHLAGAIGRECGNEHRLWSPKGHHLVRLRFLAVIGKPRGFSVLNPHKVNHYLRVGVVAAPSFLLPSLSN